MRTSPFYLVVTLGLLLPAVLHAQSPGAVPGMPPMEIKLTKSSVERMLKAIPDITKETAQYQSHFLGNLTGAGGGAMPRMDPQEMEKIRKLFAKYGFTMEEFVMQVSALVATYLVLDPVAFEEQLPRETKPEIKAILDDPKVTARQKAALRQQIQFAQANKATIRQQLEQLATPENRKVVVPLLPQVKQVFREAQDLSRKPAPGPRRKK